MQKKEVDAAVTVAVIGGGPAGLMAAEVLSAAGIEVDLYDAMPSVGRKFLLAGKGGLNLTHSEPLEVFLTRYGDRAAELAPWVRGFGPEALRAWALGLGVPTFVGSSGRVFPAEMKAAPLLRAWLARLRHPAPPVDAAAPQPVPVRFHMRHRWTGGADSGALTFETPAGPLHVSATATVLALGGASWPRLGSDGAWLPWLVGRGVPVAPLRPANCGFDVAGGWSEHFSSRFAGQPFKSVALRFAAGGGSFARRGEFVATATGIEGSLVYAASALLRDAIDRSGGATLELDLLPDLSAARVLAEVSHPRGSRSLSSHLKSRLGLDGIKLALLYELLDKETLASAPRLAAAVKAMPIRLAAARPVEEAISTAGGVAFGGPDPCAMTQAVPGLFCAGEMLDWEAPTGGYLLTACMASGRAAAHGVLNYLANAPAVTRP